MINPPHIVLQQFDALTPKSRMASLFNHHFVIANRAFTTSDLDTLSDTQPSPYWFLLQSYLSQRYRMNSPGWNKSAGCDGLDPMFLKAAAHIIAAPISGLFNLTLQFSIFPSDWKSAMVFSLFKGGSGSDPNCYRPISILPCQAKVPKTLAKHGKQLNHFLD